MKTALTIALVSLITFTGCAIFNKWKCAAEKDIVASVSQGIYTTLQCSNLPAIQSDIESIASKLNMCPSKKSAVDGELICKIIVKIIVTKSEKLVPANWGCTMQTASEDATNFLLKTCQDIKTPE